MQITITLATGTAYPEASATLDHTAAILDEINTFIYTFHLLHHMPFLLLTPTTKLHTQDCGIHIWRTTYLVHAAFIN